LSNTTEIVDNPVQAIVAAMKGVVDGDENVVIESLKIMKKSMQAIINSMETLKSLSVAAIQLILCHCINFM